MARARDRLLYPKTVAEMLNVGIWTVYRMVKRGRPNAFCVGSGYASREPK